MIPAGASTNLTVTYQPEDRPGAFTKRITVYTSEQRKGITLTIKGSVISRQKSIEELYLIDAGSELRLEKNYCALGYIQQGEVVPFTIGYTNTAKQSIQIHIQSRVSSGFLKVSPLPQIAAGARGKIIVATN